MRRLTMSLFAGVLILGSCFVSPAMAATHDVLQPPAAYAAPEKAVTDTFAIQAAPAVHAQIPAGSGGDPDHDGPAPNFASGDPDYDSPMHSLIALGVDPDTDDGTAEDHDGISLASIPGDDEDDGAGRMPLAA